MGGRDGGVRGDVEDLDAAVDVREVDAAAVGGEDEPGEAELAGFVRVEESGFDGGLGVVFRGEGDGLADGAVGWVDDDEDGGLAGDGEEFGVRAEGGGLGPYFGEIDLATGWGEDGVVRGDDAGLAEFGVRADSFRGRGGCVLGEERDRGDEGEEEPGDHPAVVADGASERKGGGVRKRTWEVASEVGAAGEFEFEVGGGLPCGEGVEEGFRGIGADETGAVLAAEEAAGDHGIETGEDAVEEAVDVEDPDGVLVDGELAPCEDLEELVEGSEAAGEGDEAVGEVDHELFAFVHGADDAHVGDPVVFEFAGVEEVGDDAGDGAVGGERAVCGGTHHADTAAAVDHADAAGGEERAGFEGEASVAEVISWAGATIDGEGAEHGRGIGEKWEEVNGKRVEWREGGE